MNNHDGCKVIAGRKNKTSRSRALALAAALALPGAGANAIGEPIPGIDIVVCPTCNRSVTIGEPIPGIGIVVKKNPGPIPVILPTDDSGRFSLRLTEPGDYTIS